MRQWLLESGLEGHSKERQRQTKPVKYIQTVVIYMYIQVTFGTTLSPTGGC